MTTPRTSFARSIRHRIAGFTLIEVMITVAIVAILAAVALPNYRNYVIRGKLVPQTNALAAMRAQMEQYYLDNRTYLSITTVTPNILSPCDDTSVSKTYDTYSLSCASKSATAYVIQSVATTTSPATPAAYTMDQSGLQATTALPSYWGALPANASGCWIMRKGDSC